MKKKILVLCTGNSCRSQMAEGYLTFFGGMHAEVFSAGIEAHGLNPQAVEVMKEDGVDISKHTSDTIQRYSGMLFDWVITVCDHAQERCPFFPGAVKVLHHNFPDPAKAVGTEDFVLQQFRNVRDEIKAFCKEFVSANILPHETDNRRTDNL
ncbi:MAG TPA: arsenate reductase ArsC [Ferruginibacter sp.]|nr:arsenate reductase ArsC [Ferruginibacter sp.]HRO18452.1 arsenate reductase ArsC [Ferruginibacter sp.]HRQ21678.1 arsenate reductase ArsC [Ferruginibacter sp.]